VGRELDAETIKTKRRIRKREAVLIMLEVGEEKDERKKVDLYWEKTKESTFFFLDDFWKYRRGKKRRENPHYLGVCNAQGIYNKLL